MNETRKIPLLPLRGMVVFPYTVIHLDVGRERSVAAIDAAMEKDHQILLVTQKEAETEDPTPHDLFHVGTVAAIRQMLKLPDGTVRVLVEGLGRGKIQAVEESAPYAEALIETSEEEPTVNTSQSLEMEALVRAVVHQFEKWVKASRRIPPDALISVTLMDDAGRLGDLIASHLSLKVEQRQELLEKTDVKERLEMLFQLLTRELELLGIEKKIAARVRGQMEKIQKDYYLREQIKAIRKELDGDEGKASEAETYRQKFSALICPAEVYVTAEREIRRLERSEGMSAETGVIRTYLDTLLTLPWGKESRDTTDIQHAEEILEKDHYGLEKVKERILDHLAVHVRAGEQHKAPILCLVGPPGVGKTSLASSVARAMGRRFVRASLGGIRDEAEIRGHRRTYIGAMPGRIIEGIRRAKTRNPVFLLDEIDKVVMDYHGDPTAALLEVLDPAQNKAFSDHYVELPFDLSHVFWILTANSPANVPRALRDRMEIIELASYTAQEKREIALRYLLRRQREENGLKARELTVVPPAIDRIIAEYTREAGVRELERRLARICRKAVRRLLEGSKKSVRVTEKNLEEFLGKPKFLKEHRAQEASVGTAMGLAWTETGGDVLPTEAVALEGKGHLLLTGRLGEVMQESAKAALSYVRSQQESLGLAKDFYEKKDLHVHFPEGAVPKDGPSAGVTMITAIVSAFTGRKVRSDVAMTGEITLRGKVLPIGGLKEKAMAAWREDIREIILPQENMRDIEEIPSEIREAMTFHPVQEVREVLAIALLPNEEVQNKAKEDVHA